MEGDVFQVLKLLAFSPECESLREQRDRLFLMPSQELLVFLLSLEEAIQKPSAQLARDCAYHYLFMGAIALAENRPSIAFSRFQQAVDAFRRQNDFYNEALALWLAGIACVHDREFAQARRLYQTATERIQQWASLEDKERDETYLAIRKGIDKSVSSLREQARVTDVTQSLPPLVTSFDFLALPSFPLFARVQAGPDGPVWVGKQQEELVMEVGTFRAGMKEYTIFSLRREDHRISFQRKRSYGWIVVHGNSMNAAEPVPITDGDLALFYAANSADDNSIVIVSCPEPSGSGYQYMIKRWRAQENAFISESEEKYPSIPRDKDHRILGVVIAIAKPISSLSPQESDQVPGVSSPRPIEGNNTKQEEQGYAELASLVGGKEEIAERLIEVERKRDPKASRGDCIARAIAKLLRDRQA